MNARGYECQHHTEPEKRHSCLNETIRTHDPFVEAWMFPFWTLRWPLSPCFIRIYQHSVTLLFNLYVLKVRISNTTNAAANLTNYPTDHCERLTPRLHPSVNFANRFYFCSVSIFHPPLQLIATGYLAVCFLLSLAIWSTLLCQNSLSSFSALVYDIRFQNSPNECGVVAVSIFDDFCFKIWCQLFLITLQKIQNSGPVLLKVVMINILHWK